MRRLGWIAVAALAAVAAGCSGKKSPTSPTSPEPPPPLVTAPAAPTGTTGTGMETPGLTDGSIATFVGRKISLNWAATPQASGYVLEIGSQAGGSDILSQETDQTTAEWTPAAVGDFVAQIKATNSAGRGPASKQVTIHVMSFKNFVESLFLGTGPYSDPANRGCPSSNTMSGWRPGTDIRVRPSTQLVASQLDSARAAADQLADATGGVVRAHVDPATEAKPGAAGNEITFSPMVRGDECPAGASGCSAMSLDRGVILAVDMFISPSSVPGPGSHEMGHSAYGFCHVVNVTNGKGNIFSYMTTMGFGIAGGKMTEADILAMRTVYGAGLRGGATRSDFVRAGLIDP